MQSPSRLDVSKFKKEKVRQVEARYKELAAKYPKTANKKDYEKFTADKRHKLYVRCQAKMANQDRQCPRKAVNGTLVCRRHGAHKCDKKQIALKEQRKAELGLYTGKDLRALQKELREVEEIDPAKLEEMTDELKLGVAILRKYLKTRTDDQVAKNPSQLMWLLSNVANLKKEHWLMKHAPEVSFSKEQVEYLFMKIKVVLITLIKDTDLINDISKEIQVIGTEIKSEGWKRLL